jgi:drug/metabolite transporter (DMT)-like permease
LIVTPQQFAMLAAFGMTNSALGLTLFLLGSRYLPAIQTALISALDAPLAPLWVWLIFAETPSQTTLIGGTIVFLAIVGHIAQDTRTTP